MAAHPFLEEQQAALADGTMTGPRLFGVKYGITSPGAHPLGLLKEYGLTEFLGPLYFIVTSEEEGREAVRKIATDKTDGVKIFHSRTEFPGTQRVDADKEKMKPEVLRAIIDESHRHSLKVFAHISFPSEAKEVVEAGGDGLVHSITMAETGTPAIFKMMADHSVYYNPTLASLEAYYGLNVDPFMTQRLRGKVWDVLLDSIENPKGVVRTRHELPGLANDAQRSLEISMANLGRAVKAGVKIVMGDDAGNAGTLHGATIPREMELMNEAGMTPMQVIVAATKTASEWIGQADKLGTLEVGKLADLIVINGDPLRDMSDIRKVELVIKNGQVIDPAAIMFDDVPAKQ
jgi:imidazolonepropionase-like amidohydrolase